ncbi:MAG: CBS domain-containing protein [Alcanivoracaceae bacterium]|jgi:CBS domain-containing protein|nr:CBS domain-containing protein [Alcanivoracaceae bacterium]
MSEASKKVSDVMARHPASIKVGTDITDVVDILLRLKTTGLPVVADNRKVVGFISEQDCLRSLLVSSYHCEGSPVVEDIMHIDPYTLAAEDNLVDVANLMIMQKPKIYPVVDDSGTLVGLLTRGHVLNALKDSRQHCDAG